MTVKGQVTIPKDVRDALGLKANEPVEIDWRGGAEAVIRKPGVSEAVRAERRAAMRARLDRVAEHYVHLRTGRDTDEFMAELREPVPTPDPADL